MLERSINGLSPAERVAARLDASASARQRMPVAPLGDQVNEARPEPSHATRHHFVAERFFGRSASRKGTLTERVFAECSAGQRKARGGLLLRVP